MPRHIVWSLAFIISIHAATDARGQTHKLKTLNDHFPFVVPETVDAWNDRAESLRRRVLVATGLWPMPEKTPIKPVLHGKIEREGFTVEKVYFESLPGHFVTGMLFRPSANNHNGVVGGMRPAVLSPHGHGGRTMRLDDKALAKQIETGGEVYQRSGRYPKLARCAHLARMGCVTFIFDMLGYADSQQVEYKTAHRHADARPEESDRQRPCFFSIEADLNLQSIMGLQTWNAIRALDFLAQLPDVDPERLGVTGGSGGGTQTILLGAIDPRIKVGFPNGMVSTSMQGGCYCENCNYLRIGTGNVELAALFAPKPQGMTAAKDWTRDMLTDGFPELKRLYTMFGVADDVMCGDLLKYPHNYNYITRSMMYPWMAKHLGLPKDTPLEEKDFEPFSEAEMTVWDDQHPAPEDVGIPHERKVLAWWKRQSDRKLKRLVPDSESDAETGSKRLKQYRRVFGGAWKTIFDRQMPKKEDLEIRIASEDPKWAPGKIYLVKHPQWGVEVKALIQGSVSNQLRSVFVLTNPKVDLSNSPTGITRLVMPRDADPTGKFTTIKPIFEDAPEKQPLIDDKRSYSAFTFGYNRPQVVKRFDEILCLLSAFSPDGDGSAWMVTGEENAAAVSAVAAVVGEAVDFIAIETGGFRFSNVGTYGDSDFVPGASKYFDLPGLLSLRAPHRIRLMGESSESMELPKRVYAAAGAADKLEIE